MTTPDHAAAFALERAEYWKVNLSELGLLSRAYIALHAENVALRKVAEAAESLRFKRKGVHELELLNNVDVALRAWRDLNA